jgi:hypothetical protein
MANLFEPFVYQLYFEDPALGAAAVVANGNSPVLAMSPEHALAFAPGGVIVRGDTSPFWDSIPGVVVLGSISHIITPSSSGVLRQPIDYVLTLPDVTTLHEIAYFNGVVQTDVVVDYTWMGTIVYTHQELVPVVPISGKFEVQVVTWTGDGSANRLIPTTFPLNDGMVAIWGAGGAGVVGITEVNFFRHNGPSMLGTAIMGVTNDPQTSAGIMSFEATGFRVTAGNFVAPFANTTGVPYVAVVLRDTTSDRRFLRCSTYVNKVGGNFAANAVNGSPTIFFVSGGVWSTVYDGLPITDGVHQYLFHYSGGPSATISPPFSGTSGNTGFAFISRSPNAVVATAGNPATILPLVTLAPTHVWIWGSSAVSYKSTEFPGAYAVSLTGGPSARAPLQDIITSLNPDGFTVVDAVSLGGYCNAHNVLYDYLTLHADGLLLAQHLFASVSQVGVGPPSTWSGIGFTPQLVFARQGGPIITGSGVFRGPAHTGTDSSQCANIGGGNDLPTGGITAIHADSVDFGIVAAPVGDPFYAWAFVGGSVTLTPIYTPKVPPPPAACVAPFLGGPGSAPCAAPAPVFP